MFVGMVDPISLQSAEIIGIPEFCAQLLENSPVLPLRRASDVTFEMPPKIGRHSIVIEQRIIDVEEKDDGPFLRLAQSPLWLWSRLHVTLSLYHDRCSSMLFTLSPPIPHQTAERNSRLIRS